MKITLLCPKPLSIFLLLTLLPEDVTEIISTSEVDFCAEIVSNRINCTYRSVGSVDEAIEQSEYVVAIWDGRTKNIISAVRKAERLGKKVRFSFIP